MKKPLYLHRKKENLERRNFYNRQKNGQITCSSNVTPTTLLSKQTICHEIPCKMTLLGHEKTLYLHRKKENGKRENFYNRRKKMVKLPAAQKLCQQHSCQNSYLQQIYSTARLSPLGSSEQLNSETCRMLELLESDMTKEAKARSGGGYSLSFDAPTPRFAPPRRRLVACAAQSKKRE